MKNIEFYRNELANCEIPFGIINFVRHVSGKNIGIYENTYSSLVDWLLEEHQILDDVEKRYISNVIKPLKTEHTYLKKEYCDLNGAEFIRIGGLKGYREDDTDCIELPFFKAGTMYKRMELDRLYTLEELGL